MAKSTFHNTQIGKRVLKLSNLDKSIYKNDGILKAEVIQYYLHIGPTILKYIKGRPSVLSATGWNRRRSILSKNKPDWTPEWIDSIALGKEAKHYIIADEEATLVWIANLAGLELHIANCRRPHFDKPDVLVFDLDPPEGWLVGSYKKSIASSLRQFLSGYGYVPFLKTSGNKGFHLFVPIEPAQTYEEMIDVLKRMTEEFAANHKDLCTLNIRKNQRTDKIFIDIQRNHVSQTIIAPFSPWANLTLRFQCLLIGKISIILNPERRIIFTTP